MTILSRRPAAVALLAAALAAPFALVATIPVANAQQLIAASMDGRISVTGSAQVSGAPDTALVTLAVISEAATAGEALSQNSATTATLIDAVKAAGIAAADVQTSGFSIYPRYAEQKDGAEAPRIAGYTVRNGVVVRVRAVATLGPLLDTAVRAGANQIDGVSFLIDNDTALRDQAREGAIRDARRKAELYAAAANVKTGRVLSIVETTAEPPMRPMYRMAAADSAAVPVEAGSVELSADVTVVFSLEPSGL